MQDPAITKIKSINSPKKVVDVVLKKLSLDIGLSFLKINE